MVEQDNNLTNKRFHELLDAALQNLPIDCFTVSLGTQHYPLRWIITALRDQNVEWMNQIGSSNAHLRNLHHDFTVMIAIVQTLAKAEKEAGLIVARESLKMLKTARISI